MPDPTTDPGTTDPGTTVSRTALLAYLLHAQCAASKRADEMRLLRDRATDPVMRDFLRLQAEYHQTENSALSMLSASVSGRRAADYVPVAPPPVVPPKPWWKRVIWWVRSWRSPRSTAAPAAERRKGSTVE